MQMVVKGKSAIFTQNLQMAVSDNFKMMTMRVWLKKKKKNLGLVSYTHNSDLIDI